MMKTKLNPCPFCGSDDLDLMETGTGIGGLNGWYYVTCWCCGAESGKEETKKKAKMVWNTRYNRKEAEQ